MRLFASFTCVAILTTGAAAAQDVSDESLAHIRERLQQPPSNLTLSFPQATFSVYVEARRPLANVFEQPPWVPVPDEFAAPAIRGTGGPGFPNLIAGGSVDPGIMAHAISRSIRTRAARAEVKRAIAEYCSAHREEPGADKICGDAPR